jgi:hypothetical protein
VADLRDAARDIREQAEAARRAREEAARAEAERRRAENERLNRERRQRIEAADQERRERLEAAQREREQTLAKARATHVETPELAAAPHAPPSAPPTPPPSAERQTFAAPAQAPVERRRRVAPVVVPAAAGAVVGTGLLARAVRASILDRRVYEQVAVDKTATAQATSVVLAGAIAAAIGTGLRPGARPADSIGELIAIVAWWLVLAFAARRNAREEREANVWATTEDIARVLGFATAPRVLQVLGPGLDGLVGLWVAATTFVALRAAPRTPVPVAITLAALGTLLALPAFQYAVTQVVRELSGRAL